MDFDITYNYINIHRGWTSQAYGCIMTQDVFTSQVVLNFSYEGQSPEPNLFLTSRIFMSIQSKSLLHISGPIHLKIGVEIVAGFLISCIHMWCPSSYAVQFL